MDRRRSRVGALYFVPNLNQRSTSSSSSECARDIRIPVTKASASERRLARRRRGVLGAYPGLERRVCRPYGAVPTSPSEGGATSSSARARRDRGRSPDDSEPDRGRRRGIVVDRDVNDPRVGANPAFRNTFGWRDDQLVGRASSTSYTRRKLHSRAWRSPPPQTGCRRQSRSPVGVGSTARRSSWLDRTRCRTSPTRKHQEEEIRASRARIVAAGDEARRRLERDLHDGAQQRLVALSLSLRLAEAKLALGPDGRRDDPRRRTRGARARARRAARARPRHPPGGADRPRPRRRGRGASSHASPLPGRAASSPTSACPPPVEAAAYYVVAEALTNVAKYAGDVGVRARVRGDERGHRRGERRRRRRRRPRPRQRSARARRPGRRARRRAPRSRARQGTGTRRGVLAVPPAFAARPSPG